MYQRHIIFLISSTTPNKNNVYKNANIKSNENRHQKYGPLFTDDEFYLANFV